MTLTTRRTALAGAAALAFAPVAALARPAAPASPIKALWGEARALEAALAAHSGAIETAAEARGIPGWMTMAGPANELGEARYGKLVAILNAEPQDARDLAIMAEASRHRDIVEGPRGWAAARLAEATLALAA